MAYKKIIVHVRFVFSVMAVCIGMCRARAQEFFPIYEQGKVPNVNKLTVKDSVVNERIWKVAAPGIYALPATQAENTGTSILICPGGGYERASYVYNGFNFAKWYNTLGINVFVLIYRMPHQANLIDGAEAPIEDAQRAMQYIRANAEQWHLDKNKIGVMGISAGGHVASMLSTRQTDVTQTKDAISLQAFRPDFSVLLSPVTTMGAWAHKGSKRNLLGADTSLARIEKYSTEKQVSDFTPPTFIVQAVNDKTVNIHNSLLYYNALIDHGIEVSYHAFPQGGHGIRITENPGSTELWLPLLQLWMKEMKVLTPIPFK